MIVFFFFWSGGDGNRYLPALTYFVSITRNLVLSAQFEPRLLLKWTPKLLPPVLQNGGNLQIKKNESEGGEIEHASYCQQAELSVYFRYLALDGAGVSYAGGITTQKKLIGYLP